MGNECLSGMAGNSVSSKKYGVAVDLRKKSITCYICNKENGSILTINNFERNESESQSELADKINNAVRESCLDYAINIDDICAFSICGSTSDEHNISSLTGSCDESNFGIKELAVSLGFSGAKNAGVFLAPCVDLYCGGNVTAALLYFDADISDGVSLYLNIGAETTVVLNNNGSLSTLLAETPVFEGKGLSYGSRTASGAIYSAEKEDGGKIKYHTIHNVIACGVCGTGIVDVVAENLKAGIITPRGEIIGGTINLVDDISVNQNDIDMLKKQKSLIYDSIISLLEKSGITADAVDRVYVTGCFGSQYNINNMLDIGILPKEFSSKEFISVGNASGLGAVKLLLGDEEKDRTIDISEKFDFSDKFSSVNEYDFN